jgi:hypothetical protein
MGDRNESGKDERKRKKIIVVGKRLAAKRGEGNESRLHGGLSRWIKEGGRTKMRYGGFQAGPDRKPPQLIRSLRHMKIR